MSKVITFAAKYEEGSELHKRYAELKHIIHAGGFAGHQYTFEYVCKHVPNLMRELQFYKSQYSKANSLLINIVGTKREYDDAQQEAVDFIANPVRYENQP